MFSSHKKKELVEVVSGGALRRCSDVYEDFGAMATLSRTRTTLSLNGKSPVSRIKSKKHQLGCTNVAHFVTNAGQAELTVLFARGSVKESLAAQSTL